jgi:tripartite-type tricarboxylate transporter receptor subunit TctC
MQDVVAGRIDFAFDTSVQLPFTRAGNIKAYAVTSDARLAQALDIPTFSEMGFRLGLDGTVRAQERAEGGVRLGSRLCENPLFHYE